MSSFFGILATVASLVLTFGGLPSQIHRNYVNKSTEGLDSILVITAASSYLLWWLYGLSKRDWFLIVSQFPGFIFSAVLIAQIWHYQNVGTESQQEER